MCAFVSQSQNFLLIQKLEALFVSILLMYCWEFNEVNGKKSECSRIKTKRKESEKLHCDVCIRVAYLNLSFDSVVWKHCSCPFCEWTLGAHWGQKRQSECPRIITKRKLSEKLLCDVCIHLKELNLSFLSAIWKHCFCRICKRIFGGTLRPLMKRKYL